MSVWAKRAALIFLSGLAGCLTTTSDRSGDRALGQGERLEVENAVDRAIREKCERGDWNGAAKICRQYLAKGRDDLSLILAATRLALVNWNAGDRVGAVIAMDAVVVACQTIGGECVTRATAFRAALREERVPKTFSVSEVMGLTGVRREIFEAARDASKK